MNRTPLVIGIRPRLGKVVDTTTRVFGAIGPWGPTLTLFGVAFAARMMYVAVAAVDDPATLSSTRALTAIWNENGRIAVNLAAGKGFHSPFDAEMPTAWLCPAIPALWAVVLWAFAGSPRLIMLSALSLQAIASSLAVVMYVLLLQRLLGGRLSPRVLAVWGLAVALWPESLLRLTDLWYYPWQELGVALLVWCGISWAQQPSRRNAVALGCTGGIVALINVTPIPLFLLAVGGPLLRRSATHVWRRAALALVIAGLIVAPWLLRHAAVFGRFVPLRGNGGFELLQGNNPRAIIRMTQGSVHPGVDPRELERYRALGEYEYNQESLRMALVWIRGHPLDFLYNAAARAYVAWFTDLTDRWSWTGVPWWADDRIGWRVAAQNVTSSVTALITVPVALFALWRSGVAAVPWPHLVFGVLLLIPLPHYFTQIDPAYVAFLRVWLMMIAVIALKRARDREPNFKQDGPVLVDLADAKCRAAP